MSCQGASTAAFTSSSGAPGSTGAESTTGSAGSSASVSSSTTEADSAPASSSSTGAGATATAPVTDVGWESSSSGDIVPEGCQGKIDLVFLISQGLWMSKSQKQLIEAFPGIIETIESRFEDFDFHIMVVDSHSGWGRDHCTQACPDLSCKIGEPCCLYSQPQGEVCCEVPDYPCATLNAMTQCDQTAGAGSVFPSGMFATNAPCKIADGRRYLTRDEPDLDGTFACVAQVGTVAINNLAENLVASLQPEINGPGGCNEGFLREDALLMITIIEPGNDDDSPGTPEEWADAVIAAKNGDPNAVVVLQLGNPACPDGDAVCQFTKLFPNHMRGDRTDPDFTGQFLEATTLVEAACEQLIPQ